ncbi:hypothetical protein AUEXF2481DRAFT_505741 [Aureobasidium subglaciale EXF-2481]|uniref:Uncharacterized protein n=1 Tax=Aureobasidium subglaciale (strain EXF-2481) TaxID=1043005 RepID=A0A074Y0D9_AURSE|nr:uncharacterized protein AUEXF2481DRAFT_505741 [Aureobasidium subglaciale EXF-2481]KEQ91258.1 hypothetical protein AUEXF2481DRAFT_505741 [Aureobasidium subglaciale EXF-2481]
MVFKEVRAKDRYRYFQNRALYFLHCIGGVSSLKQSSFPYFLALPNREPCDICDRMLSEDCLASSVTASLKWTGHGEPP